jgi:hypothetical protein
MTTSLPGCEALPKAETPEFWSGGLHYAALENQYMNLGSAEFLDLFT